MHETLCFSIQLPSPNLDDLPLRCDGCETVSCVVGSWSDRFRIVNGVSTVFRACAVDRIPLWFATVGSFPQCGDVWKTLVAYTQAVTSSRQWHFEKKVFKMYPVSAQGSRSTGASGTFLSGNRTTANEPCEPRDCRHKFSWDENLLFKVHHRKNIVWNIFTEKRQHIVWLRQSFNDPCCQKCLVFQ